jgi:hypothetical protein
MNVLMQVLCLPSYQDQNRCHAYDQQWTVAVTEIKTDVMLMTNSELLLWPGKMRPCILEGNRMFSSSRSKDFEMTSYPWCRTVKGLTGSPSHSSHISTECIFPMSLIILESLNVQIDQPSIPVWCSDRSRVIINCLKNGDPWVHWVSVKVGWCLQRDRVSQILLSYIRTPHRRHSVGAESF